MLPANQSLEPVAEDLGVRTSRYCQILPDSQHPTAPERSLALSCLLGNSNSAGYSVTTIFSILSPTLI